MSDAILIKCLQKGGRSVHSFRDAQGYYGWDLPKDGKPGAWKGPVDGVLKPHHNGLHLAKKDYLIDWLTGHHYIAETRGETAEGLDCVIARKARLVRHVPIDAAKLHVFCDNQLSMLPDILDGLAVYPKISRDVRACVEAIHETGIDKADKAVNGLQAYRYTRLNVTYRFPKDALHSIEYNNCTQAALLCLGTVIKAHDLAQNQASVTDTARILSNAVAKSTEALYHNYHFMKDLAAKGFDHGEEVAAMENFLGENGYTTSAVPDFFQQIRLRQNRDILPALGFSS